MVINADLRGSRVTLLVISVIGLGYGLLLLFIFARLTTPSEGARLTPGQTVWTSRGVIVTPFDVQTSGLREGDLVTAIDGVPMETIAQHVIRFDSALPPLEVGESAVYTVVRNGQTLSVPVTFAPYSPLRLFTQMWGALAATLLATVLGIVTFVRKPNERAARALLLWAAGMCGVTIQAIGLQAADLNYPVNFWLARLCGILGYVLLASSAVRFGMEITRPPAIYEHPRRLGWAILLSFAVPIGAVFAWLILTALTSSGALDWIRKWSTASSAISTVLLALFVVISLYGYRTNADPVTRRKGRLVIFTGVILGVSLLLLATVPATFFNQWLVDVNVLSLMLLLFPISVAVAVYRDRLLDTDAIVNRALVFALLTALVGLFFFSGVIVLQVAFPALTGQQQSDIVIVVTTLLAAALFRPFRARAQRFVDRRFFRHKYESAQRVARFAADLRGGGYTQLDAISSDLLSVVKDTVQPEHATLWLRSPTPSPSDDRGGPT